jgi:DNA-binding NtrC family response regulator
MKTPIKVLLVDDEKRFVDALCELIKLRRLESNVAYDGEQAIEIVSNQVPDVMVLDLNMPNLDGMEVLRVVKERYPEVEIIVLTGFASKYSRLDVMLMGAFEFVEKPVDPDLLIETIHQAYKQKIRKQHEAIP